MTTHQDVCDRAAPSRRRALLTGLVAGAGVLAAARPAEAAVNAEHLHLLRRATYGPTEDSLAEIGALGTSAWLDRQLDPAGIDDSVFEAMASRWAPVLTMSPSQLRAAYPAFNAVGMTSMLENTMARAIWSKRQLFEVLVGFWSNHLHIPGYYYDAWDARHSYDQNVIRAFAVGRFADMLQAAIRHPAMLRYLDQQGSKATKINENLGRELLELHTLGVGHFTEADVLTSARVLTGLSIAENGEPEYRTSYHYVGKLTLQDWSHPNASSDGRETLTSFLNYLARHPRTATRIAHKLAVRFLTDSPSDHDVSRIAKVYLAADTHIPTVVRFILDGSVRYAGAKVRTPQEDIYALVRSLGYTMPAAGSTELTSLYWGLSTTGHGPMDWAPPNGFPDSPQMWATPATALARLNLRIGIVNGWWPKFTGRQAPSTLLPTPLPATHGDLVQYLSQKLLFAPAPAAVVQAICTFLDRTPSAPLTPTSAAVGWRLPYVITLLFDSPTHVIR